MKKVSKRFGSDFFVWSKIHPIETNWVGTLKVDGGSFGRRINIPSFLVRTQSEISRYEFEIVLINNALYHQ